MHTAVSLFVGGWFLSALGICGGLVSEFSTFRGWIKITAWMVGTISITLGFILWAFAWGWTYRDATILLVILSWLGMACGTFLLCAVPLQRCKYFPHLTYRIS